MGNQTLFRFREDRGLAKIFPLGAYRQRIDSYEAVAEQVLRLNNCASGLCFFRDSLDFIVVFVNFLGHLDPSQNPLRSNCRDCSQANRKLVIAVGELFSGLVVVVFG